MTDLDQNYHLPLISSDEHGNKVANSIPVNSVSEEEIRRYSQANGHVCGECRFFELGHAAAEMASTKMLQELAKDHEWKIDHAFVQGVNKAGLCAQHGSMATGVMHAACDAFRPSNGRLKRMAKPDELQALAVSEREARQIEAKRVHAWREKNGLNRPPSGLDE